MTTREPVSAAELHAVVLADFERAHVRRCSCEPGDIRQETGGRTECGRCGSRIVPVEARRG